MNILNDELVKKYFECPEKYYHNQLHNCSYIRSFFILQATQEPIRRGERYLTYRQVHDDWKEVIWDGKNPSDFDSFHAYGLRLPDKFQIPKCFHEPKCYCWSDCKQFSERKKK